MRLVSWRRPASVSRQHEGSSRCRSARSAAQCPSPASVTAWLPCALGSHTSGVAGFARLTHEYHGSSNELQRAQHRSALDPQLSPPGSPVEQR